MSGRERPNRSQSGGRGECQAAGFRSPSSAVPLPFRRRWFIFGPGMLLAVILAGFALYSRYRVLHQGPPLVMRELETAIEPGSLPHNITLLLSERERLGLNESQVKELQGLYEEFHQVSAALRSQLDQQAAELEEVMKSKAASGKPVPLNELQAQMTPFSELSAQMARLRRTYWESALQLLSAEQQKKLERFLASRPPVP